MISATVEFDIEHGTLYVIAEGRQYESPDLPPEGTGVDVSPYVGTDDEHYADVEWSAATQSGRSHTTAHEVW